MARRGDNGKDYDVMDPTASSGTSKSAKKQTGKALKNAVKAVGKAIFKVGKAIVQALIKARSLWLACTSYNSPYLIHSSYYNIL